MKLHEAMEALLKQFGRPMTTKELALELNKSKLYTKKDNTAISPYQIFRRASNYQAFFTLDGSMVALRDQSVRSEVVRTGKEDIVKSNASGTFESNLYSMEFELMNLEKFKKAAIIDTLVPDDPGVYCIRIPDISKMPAPFNSQLKYRNHNIVYIGIASESLRTRLLHQELRAKGHGTFFRSIGAVLGYRPEQGSLANKKNKRNYRFRPKDEKRIIEWINQNLLVNWIPFEGDFDSIETILIERHLPLLNLAKNPKALSELKALRAECVRIAKSISNED